MDKQDQVTDKELKVGDVVGNPFGDGYMYMGGEGIWQDWKNTKTGESSVKTYKLTDNQRFDCKEHSWQVLDSGGNIQCVNCGLGQRIVWGVQIIRDGKLFNLEPKS